MPTNLPAEAKAKLAKYREARTHEEKIKALEEAISCIPHHKHTEKMLRQLKKRLAQLRRELEHKPAKGGRRDDFSIEREGAAQVVLLGATNTGKSSLLAMLTNAKPEIANYPMTTRRPIPGMMEYEDVEIQIVELPAILTETLEETSIAYKSLGMARNADLIVVVLDASNRPLEQFRKIVEMLEDVGVVLKKERTKVILEKKDSGGIRLVTFGKFNGTVDEIKRLLESVGIRNAVVKIIGDATIEDIEEQVIYEFVYKKGLVILNKFDLMSGNIDEIEDLNLQLETPLVKISAKDGKGLEELKRLIFENLGLMRVYTQKDGVIARKPIVVPIGTTVGQLAYLIHKELAENFRYARVWGTSVKVQGQKVGADHVLQDKDLIEIFTL
ncbi:MAG: FeoB small GTPase domain-containing protein [Nitrososphaerota archaeon]|nr:TGS domain-containing protein [Aigarchaeota archaeon]MDW8077086.1 FeoB small GTPase domain-containing protein [Nitrososphaerota archaeon]